MRSIGSRDARTHLHALLDDVAAGESVTITKRGRPVAKLVPIGDADSSVNDLLERMRTVRSGVRLDGLSIRSLIEEGRKY